MPRESLPLRRAKNLRNDPSADDPFSGSDEETPDTEFSDSEEEIKASKRKARKTKKARNYDDSEDQDDPDSDSSNEEPLTKKTKKAPKAKKVDSRRKVDDPNFKSKLDIVPLTEEELREQYKYRKHACILHDVATRRSIQGLVSCRSIFYYFFQICLTLVLNSF